MSPPTAPDALSREPAARCILLVEDEAPLRAILRRVLLGEGYRVLEAGDGEEALRLSEGFEGPIGLLLTDVWMPRLSGYELAERLGVLRPGLRVLFLSGDPGSIPPGSIVPESQTTFLAKPFAIAELIRKVRLVLGPESRSAG
jgi:two-component system cell cycle sensor histidine kinase/response regulator CckA